MNDMSEESVAYVATPARSYEPIKIHRAPIDEYPSEWIEFYDRLPTGRALELAEMQRNNMSNERLSFVIVALLIRAWSLVDDAGAPLAITTENFFALDMDIAKAIAMTMKGRASFLARG